MFCCRSDHLALVDCVPEPRGRNLAPSIWRHSSVRYQPFFVWPACADYILSAAWWNMCIIVYMWCCETRAIVQPESLIVILFCLIWYDQRRNVLGQSQSIGVSGWSAVGRQFACPAIHLQYEVPQTFPLWLVPKTWTSRAGYLERRWQQQLARLYILYVYTFDEICWVL